MNNVKGAIIGTIVTIIIGGAVYTINQQDIIKNFAKETGLTQQQAEHYIDTIEKEVLGSLSEIGDEMINFGQKIINDISEINCINYGHKWKSSTLSCHEGMEQLNKLAKDSILLGQSYLKLDSDSASIDDMKETIRLIDQFNSDLQFAVVDLLLDQSIINEIQKGNLYNKALLKTVIESN
ncbi:MAG: hypothetical protein PHG13_02180 [Candidatus Pacebacteria bacterium]|nr:hypothetical protein [Candidatus Paceibacterota bacterium]MDD5721788.1 hypothetical protein [Candidatus Paceibacterota bacterium]